MRACVRAAWTVWGRVTVSVWSSIPDKIEISAENALHQHGVAVLAFDPYGDDLPLPKLHYLGISESRIPGSQLLLPVRDSWKKKIERSRPAGCQMHDTTTRREMT